MQADVSRSDEVERLVRSAEDAFGTIDILVNNAGIARLQSIDQVTESDWDDLYVTNLKSCFLVTQAVLPGMRAQKWGRIINLSSVAAQVAAWRTTLRGNESGNAWIDALLRSASHEGGNHG